MKGLDIIIKLIFYKKPFHNADWFLLPEDPFRLNIQIDLPDNCSVPQLTLSML
jgi:hypothetical protein